MKIDPYHSQEAYLRWKQRAATGIPDVTSEDSHLLLQFLDDMERGANVATSSKKGARSYVRLNNVRTRLVFLVQRLEQEFHLSSVVGITEEQLHSFFHGMRTGVLLRRDGRPYRSTADYVKTFRTLWHWHMRVARRRGQHVADLCVDLDDTRDKAPWVYLTEEDVRTLSRHAKFSYRALILFLYDSGIRSPTELVNVRRDDLSPDCTTLCIRDEASKTFGRTIKLLLCPVLLREHVNECGLGPADPLFPIRPNVANRYLRRLATRVLGSDQTRGGAPYSDLTMYDLRHSSACYWLPRYKSESALKYRFGWKKGEMIHYYTGLLGMRDTITPDDLYLGDEKTVIEQRLAQTETEKRLLQEELHSLRNEMQTILEQVTLLSRKVP